MCNYCELLTLNGFVILESALSTACLEALQQAYFASWAEIRSNWSTLSWSTRHYAPECSPKTRFVGVALYDGFKSSEYKGSEVLDMGRGRFDFQYGIQDMQLQSPELDALLNCQLQREYSCYLGGLPVVMGKEEGEKSGLELHGTWHRDSYSLFDDEALDMNLPPFYLTVLAPLEDVQVGDSTTEFICGSHRVNLVASGIDSKEKLALWAEEQREKGLVRAVALKAGSLCVFSGSIVHRGAAATSLSIPRGGPERCEDRGQSMRPMIYAVCKKNWYNDEPSENYQSK